MLPGFALLTACTLGGSGAPMDWDDEDNECGYDPYQQSARIAAYHRETAMNDELRAFWEEDQRFYEERMPRHCDD